MSKEKGERTKLGLIKGLIIKWITMTLKVLQKIANVLQTKP